MVEVQDVYRGFIEAVNNKDLDTADAFVDPVRYRENCIGFTRGYVDWEAAKVSIQRVWKGLPTCGLNSQTLFLMA